MTPDPENLDAVVRGTLIDSLLPSSVGADERDALDRIATAYRGQELNVDPIGTALVAVFVAGVLGDSAEPEHLQALSRRIAQTLFDDDVARHRLQALWSRMCQER